MLRALDNLDRRAGLFCHVSTKLLQDFDNTYSLLKANLIYADALILEIKQSDWNGLGAQSLNQITAAADLGFKLCISDCTGLDLDVVKLQASGTRFLKIPVSNLLNGHTNDFVSIASEIIERLDNAGISVVVSEIEHEYQLLDLIDLGLPLGLGIHLAPPRPVKSELLDTSRKIAG